MHSVHGDPSQRREEQLEYFDLAVTNSGKKLEADHLTGSECLPVVDQHSQEFNRRHRATQTS
jgi:hypothetical protein